MTLQRRLPLLRASDLDVGQSPFSVATRRELLRLASRNLARSVLMLALACAYITYLGAEIGHLAAAGSVAAIGILVSAWRFRIARHYSASEQLDESALQDATTTLELNALFTGLMWIVATLAIYPDLQGYDKTHYAILICGSIAIAAFFMPLVGRSFVLLTLAQAGALVGVSLHSGPAHSLPMALMVIAYGVVMYVGASTHGMMTARSIQHGLELDATNADLTQANLAAASASEAKSVFLANMSHEIRTPLTTVIGYAESLLEAHYSPPERVEALQTIHRAGKHLLHIVNGILDLSKIDADKLEIELLPVAVPALLDEVAALARLQATEKGLAFEIESGQPLPAQVLTDPLRLRQILLNLTSNAVKFTDTGRVSIGARYAEEDKRLLISVRDTGMGIPEDRLDRLFRPFEQADPSVSRRFGGTGLGLALSRNLAELMGGSLTAVSGVGVGSCFTVSLPVEVSTQAAPAALPTPASAVRAMFVSGTILLAEDNPDIQRLVSRYVSRLGATVDVVDNGERAVHAAMARPRQLVLMDMQMPVMDGLSAVRALRKQGYRGPIVALTANATRADVQACMEAGCDDFLSKPFERVNLDAVVLRFLPASVIGDSVNGLRQDRVNEASDGERQDKVATDGGPTSRSSATLISRLALAGRREDAQSVVDVARDIRQLEPQFPDEERCLLADQIAAAAVASEWMTVRRLIPRLVARMLVAVEDLPSVNRSVRSPEDNGPIVSELLSEDAEMGDLVDYIIGVLPAYLERTELAVDQLDFDRVAQCAHDLKGVGGGYGYPCLSELGNELQLAAMARDWQRVGPMVNRLDSLLGRIRSGRSVVMPVGAIGSVPLASG